MGAKKGPGAALTHREVVTVEWFPSVMPLLRICWCLRQLSSPPWPGIESPHNLTTFLGNKPLIDNLLICELLLPS